MLAELENTIKEFGLELRPTPVPDSSAHAEGWLLQVTTPLYPLNDTESETIQKLMEQIQWDLAGELRKQCEQQPGKFTQVTEITVTSDTVDEQPQVWGHVYLR